MSRKTYKKIITSKELLAKINPKNIKFMDQYIREKNIRCSDTTIKNYISDLQIFFTWVLLYCDNKFFVDIKKIEFSEFFGYCVNELKWSSNRFSRMRSVLSTFSQFIEKFYDEEYPGFRNCILKAIEGMPKEPSREKTILTEDQVDFLLKKLESFPQQSLFFALAIASGSRFAELTRFSVDNIDINHTAFEGIFLETVENIKTKGRGKTGKLIKKYILKDIFIPHYERWLPIRKEIMEKNNIEHNSIFISEKTGLPIKQMETRRWIKSFGEILNCDFYIHCVRHFFTTNRIKAGLPDSLVQFICGWTSSAMVAVYNDINEKDREWKELDGLKSSLQKT